MDVEETDQPWNFHTCKFCRYRCKSTFVMCKHVWLHNTRPETDTFICDSKAPEMYECEICDEFVTDLKVNLCEHFRVFHHEKQFNDAQENILRCVKCANCDFEAHSLLVFLKHTDSCKDSVANPVGHVNWFKCAHCAFRTKHKHQVKRHISIQHLNPKDIRRFKCTHCLYKAKRKDHLKRHLVKHLNPGDIKWFKCEHCIFKTAEKDRLRRHILIKHLNPGDINWFKCEHCSFKTKRKDHLKGHILNLHCDPENINWFKCKHCSFKSKRKDNFKRHILYMHCDPKDINWFKCGHCLFKTTQKQYLKNHIFRKHLNPSRGMGARYKMDQVYLHSI